MNSENILNEIEVFWQTLRKSYRDSMLKVGILLHEYILMQLKESEELPVDKRYKLGMTREEIVLKAANRLGTNARKLNEMIRAAMSVELLSDNGYVGNLSYSCFRYLYLAIERKRISKYQKENRRKGINCSERISPSQREHWRIRPGMETMAKNMFQRAVEENWDSARVYQEFYDLRYKTKRKTKDWASLSCEDRFDWLEAARKSSPRDIAEIIMKMIENSNSPNMVIDILRNQIERIVV